MGPKDACFFWAICLVITPTVLSAVVEETIINSVTPTFGSLNGETRITIYGTGFAENQFNLGDDKLGNLVQLVSGTQSLGCRIHKDGTHTTQIMCYTPRNMASDTYHVRVSVDGERVPDANHCSRNSNHCRFIPRVQNTPSVSMVSPRASYPGEVIQFNGKMFTDKFETNKAAGCNGEVERILRVFMKDKLCEIRVPDGNDEYYGIGLDRDCRFPHLGNEACINADCDSDWGYMKCLLTGSYVGNQNGSYIVSGRFGRSLPDLASKNVMALGNIGMFQTFAEVTGLSTSTGSTAGGLQLTIHGKNFDESDRPAVVTVADVDCPITDLEDDYIICEVPAEPSNLISSFPGDRGVLLETFNETGVTALGLAAVTNLTQPSYTERYDEIRWYQAASGGQNNLATRQRGYIVAPHDNEYSFHIKADDMAELYFSNSSDPANKELVASCSEPTSDFDERDEQQSRRMFLTGGKAYYYELNHLEIAGSGSVDFAMKMYHTDYTADMAGNVHNEKKLISTTSTVTREHVGVSLQNWNTQNPRSEQQSAHVTSASNLAMFRLGMHGAYTEPLSMTASGSTVAMALNNLVTIMPYSVSVSAASVTGGMQYTVTFGGDGGNWPDLTVVAAMTSSGVIPVTGVVREITAGSDSMSFYKLHIGGLPSPPVHIDSTSSQIEEAFTQMLSSRCPAIITSPPSRAHYFSYETIPRVHWSGIRVSDTPAFCGRYSLKNPNYIFLSHGDTLPVDLRTRGKLCFAYRGNLQQRLDIHHVYTDNFGSERGIWETYDIDLPVTTRWGYTCVDLYAMIVDRRPEVTGSDLIRLVLYKEDTETEFFVDEVYIGAVLLVKSSDFEGMADEQRLQPNWISGTVAVTGTGRNFNATFNVERCENNLPLLGISHAQRQSGSSNNAVYRDSGWASTSTIDITRFQTASSPVGGTFNLDHGNHSLSDIPADIDAATLKARLETLDGVGTVTVTRAGSCSSYHWTIEHVKGGAGDQPDATVDGSQLTGLSPGVFVSTLQDGGIFYYPIIGDIAATVHSKPQLRVRINGIPSKCSGSCDFEWSSDATPNVTAISPTSGVYQDMITITGTGFDPSGTSVVVGGVECSVTTVTPTQIECEAGRGPMGPQNAVVNVANKGDAQLSASIQFTFLFTVSGISPTSGSAAGGTQLTITGTGFGDNVVVTVNGDACEVTDVSYTDVICLTPALSAGSYTVSVTDGTNTVAASTQFTSDAALTPTASSLSASTALVEGGTEITVSGNGFGGSAPSATAAQIGGKMAEVTSWTDTDIEVVMPALGAGSYPLALIFPDGNADTSALSEVVYTLAVTRISPEYGSQEGGTLLTITGQGFSATNEVNKVNISDIPCEVLSSTNTEIICRTGSSGVVHEIDNTGSDIEFGRGYAWSRNPITIKAGDSISWTWNTPELINNINYKVEQTINETANEYVGSGFRSGASSRAGKFTYKFGNPGTYYYWSGCVDVACEIIMRGTINVVEPSSFAGELSVMIGDYEAVYDTSVSRRRRRKRNVCSAESGVISGCYDSLPSGSDSNRFYFSYYSCSTPFIASIEPLQGTSLTTVSISGDGFGSLDCQNEVTIGGQTCVVLDSSDVSINCTLDPSGSLQVGVPFEVGVYVNNRGSALNIIEDDMSRRFALLPHVLSISPISGSTSGGTSVTINGDGFSASAAGTSVTIAGSPCAISNLTYDSIECVTANSLSGINDVTVNVLSNGNLLPAVCEGTCQFSFDSSITPAVSGINPAAISAANTTLTLTGSNFGTSSSDVFVAIGDTPCTIVSVTDSQLQCNAGAPIVGSQPVTFRVDNIGFASFSVSSSITVDAVFTKVSPTSGSIAGGTYLTLQGLGFADDTTVTVGGNPCTVIAIDSIEVQCETPAAASTSDSTVDVAVTSNSVQYSTLSYSYASSQTPSITSVSPSSGAIGDSITISGSGFGLDPADVTVTMDDVECTVTSVSGTSISCDVGNHAAGTYDTVVHVNGLGLGTGSADNPFTYELSISSVSPIAGSYGGGQIVMLNGQGFSESNTVVKICDNTCDIVGTPSATQLECSTPSFIASGSTDSCDIFISVGETNETSGLAYTYDSSLTPAITSVDPLRGGTGGGTLVTIAGSGFGSDSGDVNVTIAGTVCNIDSFSDTQIICRTGAHKPSIKTKIRVAVSSNGIAPQDNADFQYIDVWSSNFTWGGLMPPEEGDLAVIPGDMTILLDVDTPVLAVLIIQGELIFDEVDVELQAEKILIADGGLLQVGTEEEPFQHQATITMHGHVLSKELPIYGTKVLAVREGSLELHGKPVGYTWTLLASTAEADASTITVQDPVDWSIGSKIVIATTGDRFSQGQNEVRIISDISNDKMTLTLNESLTYKHLGETITYDGFTLEARAEVGLLTRNIVVRGSDSKEWHDEIERCEEGFDPGEFETQTCFQGRFGDETGNDQFGATIMFHQPDDGEVVAHIENIEMYYVGQAFRLGRYAIHFHLNGDMSGSYVRSCAIRQSFNRAVNVHATHNLLVQRNVIYNIMGGAYFTEDGVETGNIFEHNLAVFVKSSTSLQNDDITPAAFWVTNANNTHRHNHAAGGTHFGFWYRMHEHPDGPSFSPDICPQKVPLGSFYNNTVHSQGWFGVWIFETFLPTVDGSCTDDEVVPAVFDGLTAWNCEKGAETVIGGAIQFTNFKFVNNEAAGYEFKKIKIPETFEYTESGPKLAHGFIAGNGKGVLDGEPTADGIVLPIQPGFVVDDVTVVDFDGSSQAASRLCEMQGTVETNFGGFRYDFSRMTFSNVVKKVRYRWLHEAVYHDLDGSLTGIVGGKVVPHDAALPPSCSIPSNEEFSANPDVPGSVCPADVKFHRYSFNLAAPDSLNFKNVSFTNQYGTTVAIYEDKRVTHPAGWMVLLKDKEVYDKEFVNARQLTNISYRGEFSNFEPGDYLIVKHNFTQRADRFFIFDQEERNESESSLSPNSRNGEWFFDDATNIFEYALSTKTDSNPSGEIEGHIDIDVQLQVFQCFYVNCLLPPDDTEVPPPGDRPDDAVFWSDEEAWSFSEPGDGSYYGPGEYGPPVENSDVRIPAGVWMVADTAMPNFNQVFINGVLEFEHYPVDGVYLNLTLSATHIVVNGGRFIVGWENKPFRGQAVIELRGNHFSPGLVVPNGPNIGAKALASFGGLDMHGLPHNVTWTQLSVPARAGDTSISVAERVDWLPGDEIVIATTSFKYSDTEVAVIAAVSGNFITLRSGLQYDHNAVEQVTAPGRTLNMGAEVGLLSRNVRVVGASYPGMVNEAFGARVLIGRYDFEDEDGEYVELIGYSRLSDVEFFHAGQEGFVASYDPRFALAFLDTGDVIPARPTYVKNCAFNDGFSPAVGAFGANGLDIRNNVAYKTIGASFIFQGADHVIDHNAIFHPRYPGTYNGRKEVREIFDAGIEIQSAIDLTFTNNHVAGSERCGIRTSGERCSAPQFRFEGNVVHSCLCGLLTMETEGMPPCTVMANFTTYRNWDVGLFFNNPSSLIVRNYISVDNNLGLFPLIILPPSKEHLVEDKFVEVVDSIFVGSSDVFDCEDALANSDPVIETSDLARSARTPSNGKIGVMLPTFTSGSNNMLTHPWYGIHAYVTISGRMHFTGNTFTNFATSCGSRRDVAIMSNPLNEDGTHPTEISDTTFLNTDTDSKILIPRPSLASINPSDCVDMNCDGQKKILVKDLDGTFVERNLPSTIISESEWEWDGDPRRGLGDYRIPKTMLTYPNGSRIPVEDKCPNKGIYRDNTCSYNAAWQGYTCTQPDYHMLMMESLDSDTETRRISPVGVLADGYIDLINGPQDHGWCAGYTCQERLSIFPIVMAAGKRYEIDFSGTSPQNLRFHWLHTERTEAVLVGIYFAQPWRLDVYADGRFLLAENGAYDSNGHYILQSPPNNDPLYYLPDVNSASAGSNFWDRSSNTMWIILRGSSVIDIRTAELVVIQFDVPSLSVDDFFGENLVNNIAAFLDIPPEKIRIAEVVAETRRKRASDITTVAVTISNPPRNDSDIDPNDLSVEEIRNISSTIATTYQLGGLSEALNITILSIVLVEPPPDTDSDTWQVMAELEISGEVTLQVPHEMEIIAAPESVSEGTLLTVQPTVRMLDPYDVHVEQLGSVIDPWRVNVSLSMLNSDSSDSRAILVGSSQLPFINGWANFSDLLISHSGDYKLEFEVTYPTEAAHFSTLSARFTVPERQLSAQIVTNRNETYADEMFGIEIEIIDAITREKVQDVGWKGHSFTCSASLHRPEIYLGTLSGTLNDIGVDAETGIALYDDLVISHPGKYHIHFHCTSSPAYFDFTFISGAIDVFSPGYVAPVVEVSVMVTLKFIGDFKQVAYGEELYVGSAVYNHFCDLYPQVIHLNHSVYEGSIMVDFYLEGARVNVTNVLNSMWEELKEPLVITYNTHTLTADQVMWVSGESFYGLDGPQHTPSGGLDAWVIALIAVAIAMVIVVVVLSIAFYKYKYRGRADEKQKITSVTPSVSGSDLHIIAKTPRKGETLQNPYLSLLIDSDAVSNSSCPSYSSRPTTASDPTTFSRPTTSSRPVSTSVIIPRAAPEATDMAFKKEPTSLNRSLPGSVVSFKTDSSAHSQSPLVRDPSSKKETTNSQMARDVPFKKESTSLARSRTTAVAPMTDLDGEQVKYNASRLTASSVGSKLPKLPKSN